MTTLQSFYIAGIALCLFSMVLFRTAPLQQRGPGSLSLYLILEASCFLFELLTVHPAAPFKALWLALLMVTSLCIAPALWLALNDAATEGSGAKATLRWADRMPIIIGAVLTLPLISAAHSGVTFEHPAGSAPLMPLIHETMLACIAIFAIQVPCYVWRCRVLIAQHARNDRWLLALLLVVGITWLSGIVRTLWVALTDADQQWFAVLGVADVGVTVLAVYVLVRRLTVAAPAAAQARTDRERPASEAKYAKSHIDAAVRKRIVRKLHTAMREELYRDSTLSLGSLSEHLKESEHYVSQIINEELGSTFFELVSLHRIELSKRLLLEDLERPVLDIALEVGFNAKSTFNSAFKRHTGDTPTGFRRRGPAVTATSMSHPLANTSCPSGLDD